MGSATFFDAFDALSLAFAMPVLVKLWHLTPADIGWLIGASYIGQLAGAILFSRMAETRGRAPSAALATGIMSVMGIFCIFAGNLPMLFACRLIQGIGVGGEMPVAATYVSEAFPRQRARSFLHAVRDDLPGRPDGAPARSPPSWCRRSAGRRCSCSARSRV